MSSSQDYSLLYSITLIIFGAVFGAAANHVYPKVTNFLGPIIRQKIFEIRFYCVDGKRSIRKEWEERGRVENWETTTIVQGIWEWDRKSSNQNMRCYGISFSSLKIFIPMCEANLRFEPRQYYSFAELAKDNIAPELPPVANIEIYGGIGEYIYVVSGKKEPNGKVIIKNVKKTTLRELNKLRESIPAKHKLEYKGVAASWKMLTSLLR